MSSDVQVDFIKRRQQHEAFLKCFKDHLQTLDYPTDDEIQAAATGTGGGQLGSKLIKLAQNRDIQHTENSDQFGFTSDDQRDKYRRRNYLNLFQQERGPCKICSLTENKCNQYRACFNIETFRGIELFQCLNCGCPMNSHIVLQSDYNFSNSICQQVNRRYINEPHLQFKACVSIYFVDRNTAADFKIDIENFITSLNEAGFNALSFYEMDMATLQRIWLEKTLYSKKSEIKTHEFQHYQQFLTTFLEMIAKYGVEDKFFLQHSLQNAENIKTLEFYLKRLDKVNSKLMLPNMRNKVAFIFLIQGGQHLLQLDYRKFINAAKGQLPYLHTDYKKYLMDEIKASEEVSTRQPQNSQSMFYTQQQQQQFFEFQQRQQQRSQDLIFFYSSKTKNKSIRDCMLFFPQFFKLNIVSFVLTQQFDEVHSDKRKMNDTFMDMLDFNNISVFKQDFGTVLQRTLNEAFKFIPNTERFLKSIQYDGGGLNIKIGYKIGTQSLTIMSKNLPNYYKISQPTHNQTLCDRLCPELFINHRLLVIYRPLVVKSNLQSLLNNVWKLNDFVEIESDYVRLSLQEAKMLAQIERIHPQNLNNYLTMMTEGYSQIVLFARPGAYQGAKIISDGCKSGLKIRQSKKLQDLIIEHQAKTGTFIEKLPMNFHNFFESFTEQNVFLSIKDLFNLEELVLQENSTKINKNIFTNQDDHVFMVPNSDTNALSQQVRQQVIRDLPKENYNYYLYTSNDEIITEQLTSLFIPSCTQIEHIYVIVKPVMEDGKDNIEDIKQLIIRMKFSIFDCKKFVLDDEQMAKLIQLISPYKLNQEELQAYVNIYKQGSLYILSLMKQAGMKEMSAFLTGFNFNIPQYSKPQLIHEIRPFLVPCLNYEIIRFVSSLFNLGFYKFDAQTFEQTNIQEVQAYLLKYMLSYTVGVNMEGGYEVMKQESTNKHIHFRVQSVQHGDFEIRIRSLHDHSQYTKDYELIKDYELQSWYYSKINSLFPQRCPVVYQYRMLFPERITKGEIDQIFDCQEYPGRNFLLEIYRQVFDFGYSVFEALKSQKIQHVEEKHKKANTMIQKKEIKSYEEQMMKVSQYMDKRSKMIAYFWGIKLAKFTKELELIKSEDEFPNGFGLILRKENGYECKYKIITPEYEHISYVYKKHYKRVYEGINQYISEKIDSDPTFYEEINQLQQSNFEFGQSQLFSQAEQKRDMGKTDVERRITRLFNSILPNDQCCELLKANMANFKILPQNLQLQQIRIQSLREQIKTQQYEGQSTFFDWNHELREQQHKKEEKKNLITPYCNYVLSHCLPNVRPQYELAANILYLLLVELKQFQSYDKFIDFAILEDDIMFQSSLMKKTQFTSQSHKLSQQIAEMSKLNYYDWFKENFQMDKQETVNQIIKGFKDSYFIEESMVHTMQKIYKEQAYNKKTKMPELIYMFLFLKCLDELDKYIALHKQVKEKMAALSKKSLKMEQYFNQTEVHYDNQKQDNTMRYTEIEQLKNEQKQYEHYIKTILIFVASEEFQKEFYFDNEQTELRINQTKIKELKFNVEYFSHYMQNNLTRFDNEDREITISEELRKYFEFKKENNQQKEFIESKRYFQPLEQGNNQKEWDKLDQETIDEKMQELEIKRRDQLVYKINENDEIPYLKNYDKDDIQAKWVQATATNQGRFVDARPDNQKTGIYVDTVKTVEKKLDEKIDSVIKKFMQDKMNNFNKKH